MAGPGGREIGRVSVRVVPDTSKIRPQLKRELKLIEDTTKLHVGTELDTSGLVEHAKAAVQEAQAAAGDIKINTDIDTDPIVRASEEIGSLSGRTLALVAAVIALGPALIPLGAALVAAFFPLVAILGAATLGVAGLAAVAIPQLIAVAKARKALAKAEADYAKATNDKDRAKALAAEKAALAGLSPAQLATVKSIDALSKAFTAFQTALAPTVLPLVNKALGILVALLPSLTPVVKAAAKAVGGLLSSFAFFVKGPVGQAFLRFFTKEAGPAIATLGAVLGNVLVGIAGMAQGFGPLIKPIEKALVHATGAFAAFGATAGSNKGFQHFLAYVQKIGPQVTAFFGAFIAAAVNLAKAFAPIGSVVVVVLTALLQGLAKIPTTALGAFAAALVVVVAAVTAWTIAQTALNFVLALNPIGLLIIGIAALVAAFIYAYKNSETFRAIVDAVFSRIKTVVVTVLTFMVNLFHTVWPAIAIAVHVALALVAVYVKTYIAIVLGVIKGVVAVVGFFRDAFGKAKEAVVTVSGKLIDFVTGLPAKIIGGLGDLASLLFSKGVEIIQGIIDGAWSMVGKLGSAMGDILKKGIGAFIPGSPVKTGPLTVLNNGYAGGLIVKMLADGITSNIGQVAGAMGGLGVGVGALVGGASSGHTITINEAGDRPTPALILQALAQAEALHFSPA